MGRYRHSMDVIFAWLLFAVFAASSVLLVLLGVRIYAGAASGLNQTDSTVLLSYLTEKLRTCPDRDAVLLAEGGPAGSRAGGNRRRVRGVDLPGGRVPEGKPGACR